MKKKLSIVIIWYVLIYNIPVNAIAQQTTPSDIEQQFENLADASQEETEDDEWLQQMSLFRKHPLNLNTAGIEDLQELKLLSYWQVLSFLSYRKLLGRLVSLYELQAVPGWDIVTIKKIIPFVTVNDPLGLAEDIKIRVSRGSHSLLLRYSQVLEKSIGYTTRTTGNYYLGSPQKLFFRYRYQYKNLLQYGLVGDKDAGEQFFRGHQQYGFDFYSFHFFLRKKGMVQALAIGDFTVSLGQGLTQWQSLAFRKGVDIAGIKRQSPVLKPYNSAGEYNFHRGMGITVRRGAVEATAFASRRKINANLVTDTLQEEDYFSSFLMSGLNRTQAELADKNTLRQSVIGGNLSWGNSRLHAGINGILYSFSVPIQKRPELYNLFALRGSKASNFSVDYSYTGRNFHFFGEAAADGYYNKAFVNGLIISVDSKVDLSLLARFISEKYQAINANAFTENTSPVNEKGIYAGCSIQPFPTIRLSAYADFYNFPWLRYLVDAPSSGKDFFTQLSYIPNKQVEIYTRYHTETKQINQPDGETETNSLVTLPKQNWRTQINFRLNRTINLRNRVELLWYDKKGSLAETGFLCLFDVMYDPPLKHYSGGFRLQYFETGGYNSRLYAYENDVLYSNSIPALFNKGFRYYINLHYEPAKKFSVWLKWAQTIYRDKSFFGSGLDEISGNLKKELRIQFLLSL